MAGMYHLPTAKVHVSPVRCWYCWLPVTKGASASWTAKETHLAHVVEVQRGQHVHVSLQPTGMLMSFNVYTVVARAGSGRTDGKHHTWPLLYTLCNIKGSKQHSYEGVQSLENLFSLSAPHSIDCTDQHVWTYREPNGEVY